MEKCLICDSHLVEFDHMFIYAGKQINEWWSIAPLCYNHHRGKERTDEIKKYAQLWCLSRAGSEPAQNYPKTDWLQLKRSLVSHFSGFTK